MASMVRPGAAFRTVTARFLVVVLWLALSGCAQLASKPGAFTVTSEEVPTDQRVIHASYVRPVQDRHPGYLLVFTTGDAGWWGTSGVIFEHLAEAGYSIAGFSAPEILKPIKNSGNGVTTARAAKALDEMYAHVRKHLGEPDSAKIIVVGFSRGATAVAFTAVHPELKDDIAGAVAIALTRETDYLRVPEHERGPNIQVDDKDRLQIYPALKLLGSTRLAVIQSTNDKYVPSAESRQLLGPDTATLRLYQVEARDHGFRGGRDVLFKDLDEAMGWLEHGG